MTIDVTVGLPTWNVRATVLDSIRSVLAQTGVNWKLLIVDDGSTDGTAEVLRQISDERITLVEHRQNLGLAATLNEIARLCETPYLARLDADDLCVPDRLATQLRLLDSHPQADLVASDAIAIDDANRAYGYKRSLATPTIHEYFRNPYIHPSITGRSNWFRANPYDETLHRAEDADLWLRTIGSRTTLVESRPLLYYREAGNVSSHKYQTSRAAARRVVLRHAPGKLTYPQLARRLVMGDVRSAVFSMASWIGLSDTLVARRAKGLSALDRSEHEAVLRRICSIPIPGLEDLGTDVANA